jgi:RNA polymerase sigma factor (sigma-70 family)
MGRGKKRQGATLRSPAAGVASELANDSLEAQADALLAAAGTTTAVPLEEASADAATQKFFIDTINARIKRKLQPNFFDLDRPAKDRAEGKALGVLSPLDQRHLVRIANEYNGSTRQTVRDRAAELLILTNAGFVENMIQGHEARGLEAEALRQECRAAIFDAIRRFDPDNGASFLAFAEWRMRGAISEAIRSDSRLVRLKSRASEIADRVQRAIKLFEANATAAQLRGAFPHVDESRLGEIQMMIEAGKGWTPAVLADITGDRRERIQEVLPWVTNSYVRLDAPIATKDGDIDVASAIAGFDDVEGEVMEAGVKAALREALGTLSPYDRRVLELYYHLKEGEDVLQASLFDGVYVDEFGLEYSAEQSVIADRRNRIASGNPEEQQEKKIVTATQKELNERWQRGELTFRPGTPEARELFELSGVPPTSATIQETLAKSYDQLRPQLDSLREFTISRGDNALEYSEEACKLVREELKKAAHATDGVLRVPGYGDLTLEDISKLKPGKPAKGGAGRKGALRRVAELTGHVDEESGKLTFSPDGSALTAQKPQTKQQAAKPKSQRAAAPQPKQAKAKASDLIDNGLLKGGEVMSLLYKGAEYKATLLEDGRVRLEDGRVYNALSGAAEAAKGVRADPGWNSWRVERDGQWVSLFDIRSQHSAQAK